MASTYKTLLPEDVATTRTLLHEAIPLTGTILSGTYTNDSNIKTFAHGMFESIYDYPYLSSSANHVLDITMGYTSASAIVGDIQSSKKVNIYNQMALILNQMSLSGTVKNFDRDGEMDEDVSDDMQQVFFLSFARLLTKDEIKKNSFRLSYYTSASAPLSASGRYFPFTIGDYGADINYKTNSPAGDYGLLFSASSPTPGGADNPSIGHLYYQTGIAVITASIFSGAFGPPSPETLLGGVNQVLHNGTITQFADGVRFAIDNIQFNNTTELNSTIYFCRAHNTDFNYSSNPTYITSGSEIVVKGNNMLANPVSYLTTVGLYSPDNELMAVAKVSEPLKKSPSNEITLRVRLDY